MSHVDPADGRRLSIIGDGRRSRLPRPVRSVRSTSEEKMSSRYTLFMLIAAACAGYLIALVGSGHLAHIHTFDSIMTQDMAQIARNTLRGDVLETKYINRFLVCTVGILNLVSGFKVYLYEHAT